MWSLHPESLKFASATESKALSVAVTSVIIFCFVFQNFRKTRNFIIPCRDRRPRRSVSSMILHFTKWGGASSLTYRKFYVYLFACRVHYVIVLRTVGDAGPYRYFLCLSVRLSRTLCHCFKDRRRRSLQAHFSFRLIPLFFNFSSVNLYWTPPLWRGFRLTIMFLSLSNYQALLTNRRKHGKIYTLHKLHIFLWYGKILW